MYPFAMYSLRGRGLWAVPAGLSVGCVLRIRWVVLGKLRGSLEFLHILIKHKSWMKRTSNILVNGEKNLIKSIIQRCLLVYLNMIINDCSSFVFEVPITHRARSYDPRFKPCTKKMTGMFATRTVYNAALQTTLLKASAPICNRTYTEAKRR